MRADSLGIFWQDVPVVKAPKAEKVKRSPPPAVWLADDYLPGLAEAKAFNVPLFTDMELVYAAYAKERFIFDTEVYENYFLAAFTSLTSGKVTYVEMQQYGTLDVRKLRWLLENLTVVGFNSMSFDLTVLALALAGKDCSTIKEAANNLIRDQWKPGDVLKHYKVKRLKNINHIDLIEVAPLQASLKIYGGRLHVPRMQDLPFHEGCVLNEDQMSIVRYYCVNDLVTTAFLYMCLQEHITLRESMSQEYGIDLRSKSDAQIAEAVIASEIEKLNGFRPQCPVIAPGTCYHYRVPHFIRFQTPLMNWALGVVSAARFVVSENGSVEMPEELKSLELRIANSVYRMGIGGLHSSEQTAAHIASRTVKIRDIDVESFYPRIILLLGLFPPHLGINFLRVYNAIVERRVGAKHDAKTAKERKDAVAEAFFKVIADSLKITINGSFGKLGSKYSVLYAPDLLIQVTVTGQLSLLMLIERFELSGISVVSANTDGIVLKYDAGREADVDAIIKQWELDTGFKMESTYYRALYSRDVNNYIAIKEDNTTKTKGAYANPWADRKNLAARLHKNPTNTICVEAVEALLTNGVQLHETIRNCRDIRKFVTVRRVKGGAVKVWEKTDTTPESYEFLGKSIRWYYAHSTSGEIVYASNGNKVPKSDGAKPMMDLPSQFPDDIDYDRYERDAERILVDIGYISN